LLSVLEAFAAVLAVLTGLAVLSVLSVLSVLTLATESTVSTDCVTIHYRTIQNDWTAVGVKVHRAAIACTTITAGQAGPTISTVGTRCTGQTIFAVLTVKTIYRCVGVFRQLRPIRILGIPHAGIVRIRHVGIR
jgi:TRAP-type C4-dicarboxylate transport system permease large subunit